MSARVSITMLLVTACGNAPAPPPPTRATPTHVAPSAQGPIVATVNGEPIGLAEVESVARSTGLSPLEALRRLEQERVLLARVAAARAEDEDAEIENAVRRSAVQSVPAPAPAMTRLPWPTRRRTDVPASRRPWRTRAVVGMGGWLACVGACAQLSGNVAVESDYRFRGVSLSNAKPTARLAANYDAATLRWYAGASAARVETAFGERYIQLVPYAGYVLPIGLQGTLDVGATYSHFIGESADDYAEAFVGLVAERWNVRLFYSPNYFGRHVRTLYLDLGVHTPLSPAARLFAQAGVLTSLDSAGRGVSRARSDLRVGAGFAAGDMDLQLAWGASSRGGPNQTVYGGRRTGFTASASFFF